MGRIKLTREGELHTPQARHHFSAWGGIKELLRVRGGTATREDILNVLEYCGHPDERYRPNKPYLDYAIKSGWLVEEPD